jgi:hypothetical protein
MSFKQAKNKPIQINIHAAKKPKPDNVSQSCLIDMPKFSYMLSLFICIKHELLITSLACLQPYMWICI